MILLKGRKEIQSVSRKHTTGSSSQLIYHNIEKSKGQSYNFIINITNKKLSEKELIRQVEYTFRRVSWVKKIGIKSSYGFKMYMRNNKK